MARGTPDLTRIAPDRWALRAKGLDRESSREREDMTLVVRAGSTAAQHHLARSERPMHNMGAQLLAQLVRIEDRLGFVLWATPTKRTLL